MFRNNFTMGIGANVADPPAGAQGKIDNIYCQEF